MKHMTSPRRAAALLGLSLLLPVTVSFGQAAGFRRGDANGSGTIDLSDAVFTLGCLYLGSACPDCAEAGNANDDELLDLSDSIYLLQWLFTGGLPPPPPLDRCGVDPTPGRLGCDRFPACLPPAQLPVLPPSIETPALGPRRLLAPRLEALPRGARAHLPCVDGDRLFVTFPVGEAAEVNSADVFVQAIAPILDAIGSRRGRESFRMPPSLGLRMPVADFQGVVQALVDEYESNRQLLRPGTRKLLEAFQGSIRPDDEINAALQTGEGMSFAQFVAGIERQEIQYPFVQVEGQVPIEHTLLLASRWEGQGITSVRGAVIDGYRVANRVVLDPAGAAARAIAALAQVDGIAEVTSRRPRRGPELILLPYGSERDGTILLRHSYRMVLDALIKARPIAFGFLLWLDAEEGRILKMVPRGSPDVAAKGRIWNRDPGVGATTRSFRVDAAQNNKFNLELAGAFDRVNYLGDDLYYQYNAMDVSIDEVGNGSNAGFANFDQLPINNAAAALCESGTNKGFQQVHFLAVMHRDYKLVLSQGIFLPFPEGGGWHMYVDMTEWCGAEAPPSGFNMGRCDGYLDPACPAYWNGIGYDDYDSLYSCMNYAHDSTTDGHELAHQITPRLTDDRPLDWCCAPNCAPNQVCEMPIGWYQKFHDLADAWADHFESSNCEGGWVCKNRGGVNLSLNCGTLHDEDDGSPRLHHVTVPFNPMNPLDHFPEHRELGTTAYGNMQIAAAALWQVRAGMRSKCRPSGHPQYGVRFQRALKQTGFLGAEPDPEEMGLYQMLYDLELEMVEQWASAGSPNGPPAFAHNGPHTTSKVTAGFARTGLFLIPYQCLDGNPNTKDMLSCPGGELGADAVIDIDDNDEADDLELNDVEHPEVDFLEAGGPAPTFHVWTGPRYRFDGATGNYTLDNPAPCNKKFQVEVSNDPSFPGAGTILSGWETVDANPNSPGTPECYDTWTPSNQEWSDLQAGGPKVYYRVRTRDENDLNERLSTLPGNGLQSVPPPYAVITASGESDY